MVSVRVFVCVRERERKRERERGHPAKLSPWKGGFERRGVVKTMVFFVLVGSLPCLWQLSRCHLFNRQATRKSDTLYLSSVKELSLVASSAPTAPAAGMILMNEYYETCCVQVGTVYAARFVKLIHYSLWRGRILSCKLFSWLERRTRMHRRMLPSQVCTNVCFPHTYAPTYAALTSMHQRMVPTHVCPDVCCRTYAPTYAALTQTIFLLHEMCNHEIKAF